MHLYVRTYLLEYDNALPEEPLCDFGRNEEVSLGRVQQMQLDIPEGEQRVIEVHSERLCACVLHAHTSSSFFPLLRRGPPPPPPQQNKPSFTCKREKNLPQCQKMKEGGEEVTCVTRIDIVFRDSITQSHFSVSRWNM